MFVATFNIASVIYRTCAIGRGFRRLIFDANFNIVSVIYHTFVVGWGIEEGHVLCHFQYCFSHLPHLCYRHEGSGGSCCLSLSMLFHSFTTLLL